MSQAIPVEHSISFASLIPVGNPFEIPQPSQDRGRLGGQASSYEKGQLTAPDVLNGKMVLAVSRRADHAQDCATWVTAMGGTLRHVTPDELQTTVRRHGSQLAAIMALDPDMEAGLLEKLAAASRLVPSAAVIRVSDKAKLNDFSGTAEGPFDVTLKAPLARVRFTLGVTSAVTNALRRCGLE